MARAMIGQWTRKAPYHTKEHMILSTSNLLLDDYKQYDHMYIIVCTRRLTVGKCLFENTNTHQLSSITFNITGHIFNSLVKKIKEGVLFFTHLTLGLQKGIRQLVWSPISGESEIPNLALKTKESFTWSSRQSMQTHSLILSKSLLVIVV